MIRRPTAGRWLAGVLLACWLAGPAVAQPRAQVPPPLQPSSTLPAQPAAGTPPAAPASPQPAVGSVGMPVGGSVVAAPTRGADGLMGIPRLDSPVVDATGTLDAGTRRQLEQQALALQQRKGSQLQVLLVPTTAPETIEQYAVRAFEQWKIGRKGVDDGVLLVVAKDDRKVRIEVGYGLEGAIPDITAGRVIQEYLVPRFRQGDYAGGIIEATAQLTKLIDGEPLPEPVADHRTSPDSGGSWLFALIAAFFVAQFARVFLGGLPAGIRALFGGGASGFTAFALSSALLVGGIGAFIGFLIGLAGGSGFGGGRGGGRYARHRDWGGYGGGPVIIPSGGGGWGGGGFGGGGGWSGGGGMSGGGGASGSW